MVDVCCGLRAYCFRLWVVVVLVLLTLWFCCVLGCLDGCNLLGFWCLMLRCCVALICLGLMVGLISWLCACIDLMLGLQDCLFWVFVWVLVSVKGCVWLGLVG